MLSPTAWRLYSAIERSHCAWRANAYMQEDNPETPLVEKISEPTAAEIDAFDSGDHPCAAPAGCHHVRRNRAAAGAQPADDSGPDREGVCVRCTGGRGGDQFSRWLPGAGAADLQAHPRPGGREKEICPRVRRRCRRVRRLYDCAGRRRDRRRPFLHRRLHRRCVVLLRLRRPVEEDRRRAPRSHRRQEQGRARPFPARAQGRHRAAEGAAARRCTTLSSTWSRSGAEPS